MADGNLNEDDVREMWNDHDRLANHNNFSTLADFAFRAPGLDRAIDQTPYSQDVL